MISDFMIDFHDSKCRRIVRRFSNRKSSLCVHSLVKSAMAMNFVSRAAYLHDETHITLARVFNIRFDCRSPSAPAHKPGGFVPVEFIRRMPADSDSDVPLLTMANIDTVIFERLQQPSGFAFLADAYIRALRSSTSKPESMCNSLASSPATECSSAAAPPLFTLSAPLSNTNLDLLTRARQLCVDYAVLMILHSEMFLAGYLS
jgi:hypothetical protein